MMEKVNFINTYDLREFFFHVFAAEQYISKKYDLDLYDINPFLGYSGPIVSGENDFIYRSDLNKDQLSIKNLSKLIQNYSDENK